MQRVRGGLGQSAAVGLDQRAADGDQRAAPVHQRRLQGSHVVELDGGEAADEAVGRRLRHLLVEVLPPWSGERGGVKLSIFTPPTPKFAKVRNQAGDGK